MTSSIDYSNLSNEEVSTIYAQGLQVYEDQITIMDFVRKKTTEVRNTLYELEVELKKRNIQIEKVEKQNE